MFEFLQSRSRREVVAFTAAIVVLLAVTLVMLTSGRGGHRPAGAPSPRPTSAAAPIVDGPPTPAAPATTRRAAARPSLPQTPSADVYAAAVAEALWNVAYSATDRDAVLAFWRDQLAQTLPAGTPDGTTLAQAQDAGLSTISGYLPSAAMWPNLAADDTVSTFTVTGVSEPPSWVAAIASGKIADPGLTARTVIGIQKLSYGHGVSRQGTAQTQQLTVAMLCPPSAPSCAVEVFPPRDAAVPSA